MRRGGKETETEVEAEEKITEFGSTTMYIVYYNLTSIAAQIGENK